MHQLTLRVDSELADALKRAAMARDQSVNSFATTVLKAAIDPAFAGDEVSELRERLDRAGLLGYASAEDRRPPDAALMRARRRAGRGRPLASFVVEDRR
jgi:predicted transcriptional regulator